MTNEKTENMSYNSVNFENAGLYNVKSSNTPFAQAQSSKPAIVWTAPNGAVKRFFFTTAAQRKQINILLSVLKTQPDIVSTLSAKHSASAIREYFKLYYGISGSIVNQLLGK